MISLCKVNMQLPKIEFYISGFESICSFSFEIVIPFKLDGQTVLDLGIPSIWHLNIYLKLF